jgi:hypothetical protein
MTAVETAADGREPTPFLDGLRIRRERQRDAGHFIGASQYALRQPIDGRGGDDQKPAQAGNRDTNPAKHSVQAAFLSSVVLVGREPKSAV